LSTKPYLIMVLLSLASKNSSGVID